MYHTRILANIILIDKLALILYEVYMKVGYLQGQSLYIQNNEYKKTSQTEVVEVKNPNEAFQQNYINGNITEAKNCIDYIDVNYDDG